MALRVAWQRRTGLTQVEVPGALWRSGVVQNQHCAAKFCGQDGSLHREVYLKTIGEFKIGLSESACGIRRLCSVLQGHCP